VVQHRFATDPDPTFYFDAGPDTDFNNKQCQFTMFYNCVTFLFKYNLALHLVDTDLDPPK
jgi:hypothetical protein